MSHRDLDPLCVDIEVIADDCHPTIWTIEMRSSTAARKQALPSVPAARLTFKRLRRPTKLPRVLSTMSMRRCLECLRSLFGR